MKLVQPSVVEGLQRAHAALLEGLGKLENAVRRTSAEGLPELRARLAATRVHITEHFYFEEHNGYMGAVRKQEPRLERAIQLMAEEHPLLKNALDGLIQAASAPSSLDDALREKVQAWIEHVRQHEARENHLVQNAFNWDIAAED